MRLVVDQPRKVMLPSATTLAFDKAENFAWPTPFASSSISP
jgi:hypothetical protein